MGLPGPKSAKIGSCQLWASGSLILNAAPPWSRTFSLRLGCGRDETNPTGKSLPIIGKHVKPRNKKYFALSEGQISGRY